ncbi:MAG TPA: cysteine dioxygenase family protein [Burkholderiales bacterium]|nr:cysteine dioxygenase family protein [Burkholderiales bacterium]
MSSAPVDHAGELAGALATSLAPPAANPPGAALRHLVRLVEAAAAAPIIELAGRLDLAYAAVRADDSLLPAAARQAAPDRYARHLLHTDPQGRFTIVALAWGPGQFSPVHGHHTWCSYTVLEGRLSETSYAWDAAGGLARPLATEVLERGARRCEYAGLTGVHKLGNAEDNVALSLHIYGIDGARVGTHVNRLVPSTQH